MNNKPVAVIILNWNGAKLLREYLPSVDRHTPRDIADVIVADNGSTDDSVNILAGEFPDVKVIGFEKNLGFAAGYNRAIAETGYRYTVLLNSDVAVGEGWLRPLYEFMAANAGVAACQPKILARRRPGYFEYAGAAGGYLDRHGYPYCRGRIFATLEKDNGQYDDTVDVDWASGACLMVRTGAYLEAGGLDPSFFAHMEEIDLCWRMKLAGYRVCAVGDSSVHHYGGASLATGDPRKTYLNFRNNLLMLHKNLPAARRGPLLFKRRLLDTLAWGRMLLSLDFKGAGALLRAHRDYAAMRGNLAVTTSAVDMLAARPDILVEYYLKGHRTFSSLP